MTHEVTMPTGGGAAYLGVEGNSLVRVDFGPASGERNDIIYGRFIKLSPHYHHEDTPITRLNEPDTELATVVGAVGALGDVATVALPDSTDSFKMPKTTCVHVFYAPWARPELAKPPTIRLSGRAHAMAVSASGKKVAVMKEEGRVVVYTTRTAGCTHSVQIDPKKMWDRLLRATPPFSFAQDTSEAFEIRYEGRVWWSFDWVKSDVYVGDQCVRRHDTLIHSATMSPDKRHIMILKRGPRVTIVANGSASYEESFLLPKNGCWRAAWRGDSGAIVFYDDRAHCETVYIKEVHDLSAAELPLVTLAGDPVPVTGWHEQLDGAFHLRPNAKTLQDLGAEQHPGHLGERDWGVLLPNSEEPVWGLRLGAIARSLRNRSLDADTPWLVVYKEREPGVQTFGGMQRGFLL